MLKSQDDKSHPGHVHKETFIIPKHVLVFVVDYQCYA